MESSHAFIWSDGGLVIEEADTRQRILIRWEMVEAFGARVIREEGAYDQALASRRALGVRYGKNA